MPKLNLNRVPIPRQDPKLRGKNFNEVALGYIAEQAQAEASRCIQCPRHACIDGCPVEIDIPGFIKAIRDGDIPEAFRILKDKNSLPGICGRTCPQETQCEATCSLAKKGAPIAIGRLESYVADWERANLGATKPQTVSPTSTGKRVAVIGSGPAGLTAAADLAKMGHNVTIFEALHIAGGVLMYGIPEFRLPKEIVQAEVNYIASLGVNIELDSVLAKMINIDELLNDGFDAIFLGTRADSPMLMNIPGENLNGIYSANEFLTWVNLMKADKFPEDATPVKVGKRIAVIGGGNVAMDSARCSLRLGTEEVYIIYRRSEKEIPARREEVENAQEEGIQFKLLTNPKRYIGNEQNQVVGMECYEMELGEPDESGRRRPIAKPGSEFIIDVDMIVAALGARPNPFVASTTPGLETTRWGTVMADETTGKTVKGKVWAGGDIVTGATTIISAIGAGKHAAADINKYLNY